MVEFQTPLWGKDFCNLKLDPTLRCSRLWYLSSPSQAAGGVRVSGWRQSPGRLSRLYLCHRLAQPHQPPMPAGLATSPGLHSFVGNEDVVTPDRYESCLGEAVTQRR